MRRLGSEAAALLESLAGSGDEATRRAARAAEVNSRFRRAVEAVYKQAAPLVLSHVNAVYVLDADATVRGARDSRLADQRQEGAQLVVYCDDSLVRSDLDARQENLKLNLVLLGEHVGRFFVLPSRADMKQRRPFADATSQEGEGSPLGSTDAGEGRKRGRSSAPLDPRQAARVEQACGVIADEGVRRSFEEAMNASLKRE